MDESDDDLDDKPSPIKKERSPRPQSFCHSSSISPQDKLALPGFSTPRDKQRLSYGAFTNQIFVSTSTDSPTSPTTEAPPLPPRNAGKGMGLSACGLDLTAASLAEVAEYGAYCQGQPKMATVSSLRRR
ncbi:arf-GAP with SH3 domain, ANK repeat and PH domain-containing protein 1 [Cricetulus griseus]|uniref:arf-GAP with SH3 domain, ANK repeat and PH domain-containing protein 1 n=1 Tax=Cricetulus griseus TaxID=10029 RepID=UPI0007DA7E8C|nr:arf-GAP with SH3 domain, ANK repeat and PH domain-containing protein 1 [Cricetulus griseus]